MFLLAENKLLVIVFILEYKVNFTVFLNSTFNLLFSKVLIFIIYNSQNVSVFCIKYGFIIWKELSFRNLYFGRMPL